MGVILAAFPLYGCKSRVPADTATSADTASIKNQSVHSEGKAPPPKPSLPVPVRLPETSQLKLEAARHWQQIAQDSARLLTEGLRGKLCAPGKNCRALQLASPQRETEFSRVFGNALVSALVAHGVPVVTNLPEEAKEAAAASSIWLHMDVQSLKFGEGEGTEKPSPVPRVLSPGLWADGVWPDNPPHREIFVTLSALDGARYVARISQTYYVRAADARLYERGICSRLASCAGGTPPDERAFDPPGKAPLHLVDQ